MVVTAPEGYLVSDSWNKGLDIRFDSSEGDGMIFLKAKGWAGKYTCLNAYAVQKYRLVKINEHTVENREQYNRVVASLNKGDTVSFTLAKNLYFLGVLFFFNINTCFHSIFHFISLKIVLF